MSQLNLYLPKPLHDQVRRAAKKEGLSLSAWVASRVKDYFTPQDKKGWPKDFFKRFAGCVDESFPDHIDRPPPEERDWF